MEQLIINNDYVHSSQLWSRCKSTLQGISNRDYPGKNYFKSLPSIDALDLDTYEKSLHKSSTECTGDATIGVALNKVGDNLVDSYLLLVELRMGYKNGDNLDLGKIRKKVEHSRCILNSFGTVRIYQNYFFIFTDTEAPHAKNKINRRANEIGRMKQYKVFSVSEFKDIIIDPTSLPYVPQNHAEDIKKSFAIALKSSSNFDNFSNHWSEKIEDYRNRNDLQEAKHISEIIMEEICKAKNNIDQLSDIFIEMEIMEEELKRYRY